MASHLFKVGKTLAALGCVGMLGVFGGCLNRPVTSKEPTLKTNFTAVVRQAAVDKVDILFAVDNSASMGDKQLLLAQAVPDLLNRLVTPNCVDDTGRVLGTTTDGKCAQGKAEFQPVHDMHIGIVSSSLGGRGSDVCDGTDSVGTGSTRHDNDNGHLLKRGSSVTGTGAAQTIDTAEHDTPDMGASNYLAWFPSVEANNGKRDPEGTTPVKGPDPATLIKDFQEAVGGVHEYGCGLEAQLESWYRFLVQPDPYASIVPEANDASGRRRTLDGVDGDILKQRHDFLREDSLVAIIVLTDEDDSTTDPRAVGGQGWAYENKRFPGSVGGGAARGTSACDDVTKVNTAECTSCGFSGHAGDPNCQKAGDVDTGSGQPQPGYYKSTEDPLNVRFIHMKQRYGVDPQFPIKRYVDGLKSYKVPSREAPLDPKDKSKGVVGETYGGVGADGQKNNSYLGIPNCTNPLFAKDLPTDPKGELCNLARGARTPDLVFYAIIGGVPWQLLTDQSKPEMPFKSTLSRDDWKKLVGANPGNYDYTGQDPHMVQSLVPRPGITADQTAADTADPFHGREWDTGGSDLQYACTFQLPAPKNCKDGKFAGACDCTSGTPPVPPLCAANPADGNRLTLQVRGKAYPTIRELTVARDLGDQAIVASLCPRSLDPNSPDYGYRPAVRAIVDRLKNALANQCLPQQLIPSSCGEVPCLILETLRDPGPEEECNKHPGLSIPAPEVLAKFREQQKAEQGEIRGDAGAGFVDETTKPVCQVTQLVPGDFANKCANPEASKYKYAGDFTQTGSCGGSNEAGWCYLSGAAAGPCPQSILFSPAGNPQVGAKISLQCIEASSGGADGGK